MIRVIEGTPGTGKTCWTVEQLIRTIESGIYDEYYSNIENLRIAGVRDMPEDWRTLNPDKSDKKTRLCIIDEAQYWEPFMKENRSAKNEIGKDLSTHRHYGIDFWLISQSNKLLNDYVLANAGEHVYMYRARKKKSVKVYWFSHVQKTLSGAALKGADDEEVWYLNPSVFDYYKSTSAVTDGKVRRSKRLTSVLITAFIMFAIIFYFIFSGIGSFKTMMGKGDKPSADDDAKILTLDTNEVINSVNQIPQEETFDNFSNVYTDDPLQLKPVSNNIERPVNIQEVKAKTFNGAIKFGDKCKGYNHDLSEVVDFDCDTHFN